MSDPTQPHLTLEQKNQLLTDLISEGFGRGAFAWEEAPAEHFGSGFVPFVNTYPGCILVHRAGSFAIRRFKITDSLQVVCIPHPTVSGESILERVAILNEGSLSFDRVLQHFRAWLAALKRGPAVDLWAIPLSASQTSWADPDDNRSFTADERQLLSAHLDTLERTISSQPDMTAQQKEHVAGLMSYLRAGLDRMLRIDWSNALMGVLLKMMLERIIKAPVWLEVVWPFLTDNVLRVVQSLPPA